MIFAFAFGRPLRYAPVVEVSGGMFLLTLSLHKALSALGPSEAFEVTPIPRSQSSPMLVSDAHLAWDRPEVLKMSPLDRKWR